VAEDRPQGGRQEDRRRPRPAPAAQRRQQRSDEFLTYLAKAGDVRKVGAEDVNGIPTTHYHATIEFAKLAGSAGAAADSVRQLEKLSGQKSLPTDIWIDASQRVRRQTVSIAAQQPLPIKFDLTIDYKRFGVPVDVHAPPSGETADYADVIGG
jgi:hypothetical protein